MNIRTLMTTSLVTLLLVGGAQAKEGDNYSKIKATEQTVTSIPAAKMAAATTSESNNNRWLRHESDRT